MAQCHVVDSPGHSDIMEKPGQAGTGTPTLLALGVRTSALQATASWQHL